MKRIFICVELEKMGEAYFGSAIKAPTSSEATKKMVDDMSSEIQRGMKTVTHALRTFQRLTTNATKRQLVTVLQGLFDTAKAGTDMSELVCAQLYLTLFSLDEKLVRIYIQVEEEVYPIEVDILLEFDGSYHGIKS